MRDGIIMDVRTAFETCLWVGLTIGVMKFLFNSDDSLSIVCGLFVGSIRVIYGYVMYRSRTDQQNYGGDGEQE